MAFQTGTSTSIQNLMDQLEVFANANGWTTDFSVTEGANPGQLFISKNSIFVGWIWDESEAVIGHYINLSNDDSVTPWNSTGDDGNGYNNAISFPNNIDTGRHTNRIDGPHTAYWFFEQDSSPAYIHVVVEVDTGRFRHFGFGELEKVNDWVGGEYSYGHQWGQATSEIDNPSNSTGHHVGLEANMNSSANQSAGVHVRDFPDQVAADRWMNCRYWNGGYPDGTDRAGNNKGMGFGGWRGGIGTSMTPFKVSQLTAFKPMIPVTVCWFDVTVSPDIVILMGTQPDVRMVNMANIDPGEILSVAGEDWFVFPLVRKQFLQNNTEESWNAGVAYRREIA